MVSFMTPLFIDDRDPRLHNRERENPYIDWLKKQDKTAMSRVRVAIDRLRSGNTGNLKSVGDGVYEIRLTFGAGFRIYLGWEDDGIVILLQGGTKHRQSADIAKAKDFWRDYLERKYDERGEQ